MYPLVPPFQKRWGVHVPPVPPCSAAHAAVPIVNLHLDINIVTKAILRLKPDKALGPDELSPKLLIETCNEIAYPLLLLFRKSLNESSVPNDWKQANVTPIFKKGFRSSVEIQNYRPVSLTS